MLQIIVFFITGILFMLIFMLGEAKKLTITHENVTLPISMNEKKVLFISDLHNRKIERNMLQKIPEVDFVIIGGDLCESGSKQTIIDHNLQVLSSFGRTLFVWGNNDYGYGEKKLSYSLKKHNIQALNNESFIIKDGRYLWTIAGVEDLGCERSNVDLALSQAEGPILLISHNPEIAYLLNDHHRHVRVILAGHTHGGQIRLGPLSIAEKGGWKMKNNFSILISNGFGTTRFPARLGAIPEVHVITIQGEKNQQFL
jgi:predicted MPP superfamily phosphohydrolase